MTDMLSEALALEIVPGRAKAKTIKVFMRMLAGNGHIAFGNAILIGRDAPTIINISRVHGNIDKCTIEETVT